jgi:hypothetical protein
MRYDDEAEYLLAPAYRSNAYLCSSLAAWAGDLLTNYFLNCCAEKQAIAAAAAPDVAVHFCLCCRLAS